MKPRAISFFDLDHTLLKVSSSFRFGVYLYKHGVFSSYTMLNLVALYWLHVMGMISIQVLQKKIFKRIFLGHPISTIQAHAKSFLEQQFEDMVYLPVVQKLQQAKQEGQYTVILSSSPHFLVSLFAERLEVDEWGATHYAVDSQQRFCTISQFMLGQDKACYVAELMQRLKISKDKVTVYSDSHLDLPFLQAAGTAVGVNPNKSLRVLCKKNNWNILIL